jgi:ribosome-associated translation inhibitor RaiA
VAQLDSLGHHITSCHIQVDAPHHHQWQVYHVRIELVLPSSQLVIAGEPHEDLYVAIRDAFDTARRQLDTVQRQHTVDVRPLEAPEDYSAQPPRPQRTGLAESVTKPR